MKNQSEPGPTASAVPGKQAFPRIGIVAFAGRLAIAIWRYLLLHRRQQVLELALQCSCAA